PADRRRSGALQAGWNRDCAVRAGAMAEREPAVSVAEGVGRGAVSLPGAALEGALRLSGPRLGPQELPGCIQSLMITGPCGARGRPLRSESARLPSLTLALAAPGPPVQLRWPSPRVQGPT